jgi:hypothetical protein
LANAGAALSDNSTRCQAWFAPLFDQEPNGCP